MPFDAELETVSKERLMLQIARDRLAKRGCWIKEDYSNTRGGFCIVGALHWAALKVEGVKINLRHDEAFCADADDMNLRFLGPMGLAHCSLQEFNDHDSTRRADVLAALDRAIDALK